MFSPSQNGTPAAPARTSRRRQRPSGDSIAQPKAKRQRSALTETTFLSPEDRDGAPEMEETKNHKMAALVRHESVRETPLPPREIAVRGKKPRSADKGNKGDGSVILTTNDTYTVSKLPALPDRLRADAAVRQHGAVYSDTGYALALTHTHAIVWPYAVNIPSPETFTFALPQPSKHVSDPLPLGSLVSASASSSDPGLVVVIPTTGKVTYWESISSAATLDLRLQRNGVELSIQGMYSGESIVQILNAESAGFILAFSSGRIAYMSVRDGQGRPAIAVQFLRGGSGPTMGGIFGSLRNALSSSSWHGDIAAVRAGRPERVGERNVVLATAKGKIQSWNIQRGGHSSIIAECESREAIVMAIKKARPVLSDLLLETFELLDFTFTPKSVVDSQLSDQESAAHILVLVSMTERQNAHYFLVEVVLQQNRLDIGNVRPIKSYTTPISRIATSRTRLYLPTPALVAYVVFDRAVIVISMARQPDSPELQLRTESHLLPQAFEDVIDFREEMNIEIVGSGMEEPQSQSHSIEDSKSRRHKAKYPATVLLVRGGGVIRVAATNTARLTTSKPQQVTARSKLEQAIFFGTLEHNPLSFTVRPELQFSAEEVGLAAVELSLDILKSQTPYIPSVPASVDQNLRKRSAALRDLAKYLKTSHVQLDRVTRWKLLWDAERSAAATLIWKRYDTALKDKPAGQKRGLLAEIVEFIHEDYKSEPVPEAGELDRVRHWFIRDIWNLEIAIPWAYQVIKHTYQDGQKDHGFVMGILSEADDMVLSALQGAYDFRTANLELYGLGSEQLKHGVLEAGYEGLPDIWTSTFYITENLRKQADLAGMLVRAYWNKKGDDNQVSHTVVDKIRLEYAALLDISIRANKERSRWAAARESPAAQIEEESIRNAQVPAQNEQIVLLATDLELPDEAIELAEKHEILPTLAHILQSELDTITRFIHVEHPQGSQLQQSINRTEILRGRVKHCFQKFGTRWATAFFESEIQNDEMSELLDGWPEHQSYLTSFLRSRPDYAKLSWINDINQEEEYGKASKTLLDLGLKREQDLWSKKIELSVGKLALLADRTYSQANGILIPDGGKTELTDVHDQLGLIKIQNQLYDFVLPSITTAIDENAELQLALEVHANKALQKQQSLLTILGERMGALVRQEAMTGLELVDLLTLIGDHGINPDEQEMLRSQQFFLALQASCHGLSNKDEQNLTQKIIWRRCFLKDDWTEVNNTAHKDDQQVSEQLTRTALYQTFRACFKASFFEKNHVAPIQPTDVLGAGTEELDHRFKGLDMSIRESIMKDMEAEDQALQPLIAKCRLDKWFQSALDQAKRDHELELSEQTDDVSRLTQATERLAEVEQEIKENEMKKAQSLLHSKPRYKPRPKASHSIGRYQRLSKY